MPETKISKLPKASSAFDHHTVQVCSTPTTLYMASISAWWVFPHSSPNQTQNLSMPELCQHYEALSHPPRTVNLPPLYSTLYLHVIFPPSPRRPWQESEAALDPQGTAKYESSIFNSDTVWQTSGMAACSQQIGVCPLSVWNEDCPSFLVHKLLSDLRKAYRPSCLLGIKATGTINR